MAQSRSIIAAVDDDVRVRESIQSVIESAGYDALVFASAQEFLQSGALARARCLIADVRMPGIGGIELQRQVRNQRPQLPIIFITAHDDEDIRQQALREGAADFLLKPFDAAELLLAISRGCVQP